jgi:nucleotide-binding universal stress UspA family protein
MKKFTKILVPVEGVPRDDEVLRLASLLARQDKATLLAIYVIEIQRTLPLETENATQIEQAELVLQHAEQVTKQYGARADTDLLQARIAGPALVDEATEREIDLIIMGVPYREPLGELRLGDTASYVMKNAPCQVWLCREAFVGEPKAPRKL